MVTTSVPSGVKGDETAMDPVDAAGDIRVERERERTVVLLVGEVDAQLRAQASAAMSTALTAGLPVLLDATETTFIDSAGLAFVLQLHAAAAEESIPVTLLDPQRVVRDVLDLVGMPGHLQLAG